MQSHINPPAVSLHGDALLYGLGSHGLGVVCLTASLHGNALLHGLGSQGLGVVCLKQSMKSESYAITYKPTSS